MLTFDGAARHAPEIDAWLDLQDATLGAIARTWFDKMRACGDDVTELMHDGAPTVCVGNAPFCYIGVYRGHVNAGFFYGADLPDPAGILEGNGKRMRHVKLKPGAELPAAALDALIDVAYADLKDRLARLR